MELTSDMADAGFTLTLLDDPPPEFRASLGQHINAFHSLTVPYTATRFGLRLTDPSGELVGGVSGVMSWGWLFIDAVWVRQDKRGHGTGRQLMQAAERHAAAAGCHAVWLDTFQAREFYQRLGYQVFGSLENYPATQTRYFLRKALTER